MLTTSLIYLVHSKQKIYLFRSILIQEKLLKNLTVGISLNIAVFRLRYKTTPIIDPPIIAVIIQQITIIKIIFSVVSGGGGTKKLKRKQKFD